MAKRKPDDMRFVDNYVNHWEGTAQLDPGPAPTAEQIMRSMRDAERILNPMMPINSSPPIVSWDPGQSYRFIPRVTIEERDALVAMSGTFINTEHIPMEDRETHDIKIGPQRRMYSAYIARPFAKFLPDGHKATIFDKIKWLQVEINLKGIDKHGRSKWFEMKGAEYLENWKRLWKETRK